MTDGTKKSTYNPVAQKRYDQKRKKLLVLFLMKSTIWLKNIHKKMDLQVLTVMFWVWLIMI